MTAATFNDLLAEVEENNGVLTVGMWALRNMRNAGKLGKHVIAEISAELAKRGLGHIPEELPSNQDAPVRIYLKAGPVGRIIEAVQDVDAASDEVLRTFAKTASDSLRDRLEEVIRLADAMGPNDPGFDMKKFTDEMWGDA